ncbi:hypothetical protein R5M92_10790 [Halomonas sp. Bachu 37]|uniref:hypothetical protein n=1 Tax=Halomonas kashgarensis TaxID=3084920 RepID=UPI003217E802
MSTPVLFSHSAKHWLLVPLCFVALQATANETYDLTFQGDGSFSYPHAGDNVEAAIVEVNTDEVVAKQSGTIADTTEPAFTLQFDDALEEGKLYDLHYWIDSNFGGGNEGVCDPENIDHQWRIQLGEATGDMTEVVHHAPEELTPVCATFE